MIRASNPGRRGDCGNSKNECNLAPLCRGVDTNFLLCKSYALNGRAII